VIYVPKSALENEQMAVWAANIIKQPDPFSPPYMCMGFTRENKMACVIVAHDYRPPNICLSFAAVNPRWATRQNLEHIERWVYDQLKCTRITGIVDPRNDRARKFDEGIGFKLEGTLRRARPDGGKLLVYGLIREDFRKFIERKRTKHEQAQGAKAA